MAVSNPDEQAIFNAARLIDETVDRREYLEETCGSDCNLQARVEALLQVHEKDRQFLAPPVTGPWPAASGGFFEGPDAIIGPYRLIRHIGIGGMGTVYLAEQDTPVRRQVALKVLNASPDTRQVVARFESERQVLAIMDHPNIAKVHDAGETPPAYAGGSPRPYFVMELVPGIPITKHCDEHRFTPRQRVELFLPVCRAVQHAHQKGIIHRDLKPANVLVALYDGQPVPKVIDFGVAKAIGNETAPRRDVTEFGAIIGSLEYMSPEQSDPHQFDTDTRSDVYSLGVLLYELLTGTTPLRLKHDTNDGFFQMLRIIREDEPPKPSAYLTANEDLPSIAANRGLEPRQLCGLMRGDLDWIVMKSLEKNRKRRYESVSAMARDIERYLADEPVEARPPSPMYRLKKYARRHRVRLAAISVLAIALLMVVSAIGWAIRDRSARENEAERHRADRRQAAVAALDKAEETLRAGQMAQVATFLARSAERLVEGGVEDLRARQDLLASSRAAVLELDDILVGSLTGELALTQVQAVYTDIFHRLGIDVGATDLEVTAEVIRGSPIRDRLLDALDEWLAVSRRGQHPVRLRQLLALVDPDPYRTKVREHVGVHWGELPEEIDAAALSPALAGAVSANIVLNTPGGANDPALRILRVAWAARPDRFDLNFRLAQRSYNRDPPLLDDAVAYYRAALCARPNCAAAWSGLGSAMKKKNELEAAAAFHRRALELGPNRPRTFSAYAETLAAQAKFAQAVTLLEGALDRHPEWGGVDTGSLRYDAACCAVMAGTTGGINPFPKEQWPAVRLRALRRLKVELKSLVDYGEGVDLASFMRSWLTDPKLAAVRETMELAKLPVAERKEWEEFWVEVKKLRDARKTG